MEPEFNGNIAQVDDESKDTILEMIKRNGLIVEYLPLAIVDLSIRRLIKLHYPVQTVLCEEPIRVTLKPNEFRSPEEDFKQAVLERYTLLFRGIGVDLPSDTKVQLIELELTRVS